MNKDIRDILVREIQNCRAPTDNLEWNRGRASGIHLALILDAPGEPCGDPDCTNASCARLRAVERMVDAGIAEPRYLSPPRQMK